MRGNGSLTTRLIGLLVLVQTGVAVAGMTAWMLFSPFVSFEDVSAETTRQAVVQSLRQEGERLEVRPGPELLAYAGQRPGLAYAAIRDNFVLPGSSDRLAAILARLGPVLPRNGQIDARAAPNTPLIRFASVDTAFGEVVVASMGDVFGLGDFGSFLTIYLAQLLPLFGPAVLMAALVIPVVVRRSLKPVVDASRLAETIEIESLHRRIPAEALPREVAPLATAVNELLGRLEDGIARQRLFSANAAHELRTPVAILEAKIDGLPSGPVRHDLKRAVNRIALLLNQLLAVARLGQREVRIDEDLDLQALLRAVVADCAPLALRLGRAVAFQGDAHVVTVCANRQALASALANLIDNALSYEPVGGTVLVTCAREGQAGATVTVEDHGPGIPAALRDLVFEPFWRKDEARVGSGLGLSIAAQILRLHGGEIGCRETPGGGATFVMSLPVAGVSSGTSDQAQARSA